VAVVRKLIPPHPPTPTPPPPPSICHSDKDYKSLLLQYDTDAFKVPIPDETCPALWQSRVGTVLKYVEERIEEVDPDVRKGVRGLFELTKALDKQITAAGPDANRSDEILWSSQGIAIESLRHAIVEQVNKLLFDKFHDRSLLINNKPFIARNGKKMKGKKITRQAVTQAEQRLVEMLLDKSQVGQFVKAYLMAVGVTPV
jgi:hypothetical protein